MLTIDSCGSESRPGLNYLDKDSDCCWNEVTIEERISALRGLNRISTDEHMEMERWSCHLIRCFGHSKISQTAFVQAISGLNLAGCSLKIAEVQAFVNLKELNLEDNLLVSVNGLEFLYFLEDLNLRKNEPMARGSNAGRVMDQIRHMTSLTTLFLPFDANFGSTKAAANSLALNGSRQIDRCSESFLFHIIATSPLKYFNGRAITIHDRVAVFSKGGKTAADVESYLVNLVLVTSISYSQKSAINRFLPDDVGLGVYYDPMVVVEFPDIHSCGLTSRALQDVLPAFQNLVRLNLAHNRLNTLGGIGLDSMQHLSVLDVSFNLLADPLAYVAELLDGLPSLQFVALRGNPNMKTPADRLRLIGLIQKMRNCEQQQAGGLLFIDSEISLDERIQAWMQAEIPRQDVERMRCKAVLAVCSPSNANPRDLIELDLNGRNLQVLVADEFTKYQNLLRLHLQRNGLSDIACICKLTSLQLLDLRDNQIQKISQIIEVVAVLTNLVELGADENSYMSQSENCDAYCVYRRKLIQDLLPFGLSTVGYPLRFLDDRSISVAEIIAVWHANDAEKQRFAFEEGVHRAIQSQSGGDEQETICPLKNAETIFLSGLDLEFLDFARIPSLTSVDISCNLLVDFAIAHGGFQSLPALTFLDVSCNNIQSADCLTDLIKFGHQNRSLSSIVVHSNPFFPSNNDQEDRVRFLSCIDSVQSVGATLKLLNNTALSVFECCEAARCSGRGTFHVDIENLKVQFLLEESTCTRMSSVLRLSHKGVQQLESLSYFINLESIDLRGNRIHDLSPLQSLPKLAVLDVRDNEARSMQQVFCALQKCDNLRSLWLERVSVDWADWLREHPSFWKESMRLLPALFSCDDNLNPAPLASFQWVALCHIKRRFRIGPNGIGRMDLRGCRIRKEEFYAVRDWMAFLPVAELRMDGNPCCRAIPIYRFMLIHDIKTLRVLNGSPITEPERAAAFKKVDQMKRDFAYYCPELDSLKTDNYAKGARCVSRLQRSYGSSASAASSWGSQLESFVGYVQVQTLLVSIPGIEWDAMPFYKDFRKALQPLMLDWDALFPELQVPAVIFTAAAAAASRI